MFDKILYTNEWITLVEEDEVVYIKVQQKGYDINEFQNLLKNFPRIKLTQFTNLRAAINNSIPKFIAIGEYKPLVEIEVSKDRLEARATLNISEEEFPKVNPSKIVNLIIKQARQLGINFGLDVMLIMESMVPIKPFIIAFGQQPVTGDDAVVSLYEIEDIKPEVYEDGKVNHYELNLINKVAKNDWVGQRKEPTEGLPGRTVFGEVIPALRGKQEKLVYDRKTIQEVQDKEKKVTTLRAKKTGAVVYENGLLSICNFLEVNGKVSFETGNVDFDGYVEIKKVVEDNFSVTAENDIQIMGDMGLGAVDTIESRNGSIYIRGGIAGKNKARIVCDGDLYTKFAADCTIECNGTVHIGFYSLNCNIKAKEVILESTRSKIIGGTIDADIRVYAGEIGSKAENHTYINLTGFNRQEMKEEYDNIGTTLEMLRQTVQLQKQKIAIYRSKDFNELSPEEKETLEKLETDFEQVQKSLHMYQKKKKDYTSYLHSKGEGEVKAMRAMYPNVHIKIKNDTIHNANMQNIGISYYMKNREIVSDI